MGRAQGLGRHRLQPWHGMRCSQHTTSTPWHHIPTTPRAGPHPQVCSGPALGEHRLIPINPGFNGAVSPRGAGAVPGAGTGAGSWDGADPTARPGGAAHGAGHELTGTGGSEQPCRHCQSPWRAAAGAGCPPDPDLPGERAWLPAGAGCSPAATEGLWLLLSLLPALLVQPAPGPCHHGLPCSPAREWHRLWPCWG